MRALAVGVALALAPASIRAQSGSSTLLSGTQRAQLTGKFRERLREIARTTDGTVGIGVIDLRSGERFGVNDTLVFPQGSAIKIPILLTLFHQAETVTLSLEERVAVRSADQVAAADDPATRKCTRQ